MHIYHASSESEVENELGVDKFMVSTSFDEANQARNKRELLERLDSVAQKLKTLQIKCSC